MVYLKNPNKNYESKYIDEFKNKNEEEFKDFNIN